MKRRAPERLHRAGVGGALAKGKKSVTSRTIEFLIPVPENPPEGGTGAGGGTHLGKLLENFANN